MLVIEGKRALSWSSSLGCHGFFAKEGRLEVWGCLSPCSHVIRSRCKLPYCLLVLGLRSFCDSGYRKLTCSAWQNWRRFTCIFGHRCLCGLHTAIDAINSFLLCNGKLVLVYLILVKFLTLCWHIWVSMAVRYLWLRYKWLVVPELLHRRALKHLGVQCLSAHLAQDLGLHGMELADEEAVLEALRGLFFRLKDL